MHPESRRTMDAIPRRASDCLLRIVLLVLMSGLAWLPGSNFAEEALSPLNVTVAGYSAGGMLGAIGDSLSEMVRREYPGSSVVYEPGSPAGALMLLAQGKRSFGVHTPTELRLARAGAPPFPRALEAGEILPVARLGQGFLVQVYVREGYFFEHGIHSLRDVARRKLPLRVSTNPKGNLMGQAMSRMVLEHFGLTYAQIEATGGRVVYLSTRPSNDLMRNGQLDLVITAGFAPSSSISELSHGTSLRFIRLPDPLVARMCDELDMEPAVLPAGTYDFLKEDLRVPSASFLVSAGTRTSETEAYQLARALYRQFDFYRGLHPSFAELDPAMLVETGKYPRHPGADRWYREIGLLH